MRRNIGNHDSGKQAYKKYFVNNVDNKLSQYADDAEFLLACDRESFETCITVTDNFGRKSGLYMNAGKTSAVWFLNELAMCVKELEKNDTRLVLP